MDVKQGLGYCQNEDDFYKTVLMQFASEAPKKRADLERFFKEKALPDYAILIHALKSTAKMIGANALSEKAKALEAASKEGRLGEVEAGHGGAMADYDALVGAINEAFGAGPGAPPDEADDTSPPAEEDGDVLEFDPEEVK